MSQKPRQQAVTLRKGPAERVLLTLVFIGSIIAIAVFAWLAAREQVEDLSPLLLLFVPLLLFLLPLTVYMWRWRVVLDKDGLHRRHLFKWKPEMDRGYEDHEKLGGKGQRTTVDLFCGWITVVSVFSL